MSAAAFRAIGQGVLTLNLGDGDAEVGEDLRLAVLLGGAMLGVLTVATVLLFTTLRTDLSLTERESSVLLIAYLLFVAWVVAETVGATTVLRGV
jgi:hypothetical protein